ncbi:MAG: hypothetical protein OHK0052_06760 [Anaerolineales bacterium]
MKHQTRVRFSALVAVIMLLVTATGVYAQQAYTTAFTTSITYQNVGDDEATITFSFYNENSATPITFERTLAQNAGSSLFIGGLQGDETLPEGFQGSAMMAADQPILATLVQIPQNSTTVKNRPLSNGFSMGASDVLIASVLKNTFNTNTRFSVQNVDASDIDITVTFNPVTGDPIVMTVNSIPSGAAKYFDTGLLDELGSTFNGSVVIKAVQHGTATPANVVASALELQTNNVGARAFEGVYGGSQTVYMPSALCNAFGGQTTAYAVQNLSEDSADVTVTYSNGNNETKTIGSGQKTSFLGCDAGNPAGFSGAAIITSDVNIVAIGKVGGSSGLYTAFLGETAGYNKLALPYVRWTTTHYDDGTRQRTNIAIQNVGGDLAAGSVQVKYVNKNGEVVGIETLGALANGEKLSSNASKATLQPGHTQAELDEFGTPDANPGGGFGGAVIIESPAGSQLVAVARVASKVGSGTVAEDYNGIPLP